MDKDYSPTGGLFTEEETRNLLRGLAAMAGVVVFFIFLFICNCCVMGPQCGFSSVRSLDYNSTVMRGVNVMTYDNPTFTIEIESQERMDVVISNNLTAVNQSGLPPMEENYVNLHSLKVHDLRSQIPVFTLPNIELEVPTYTPVYCSYFPNSVRDRPKSSAPANSTNPPSLNVTQEPDGSSINPLRESNNQSSPSTDQPFLEGTPVVSVNGPSPNNMTSAESSMTSSPSMITQSISESLHFVPAFIEVNLDQESYQQNYLPVNDQESYQLQSDLTVNVFFPEYPNGQNSPSQIYPLWLNNPQPEIVYTPQEAIGSPMLPETVFLIPLSNTSSPLPPIPVEVVTFSHENIVDPQQENAGVRSNQDSQPVACENCHKEVGDAHQNHIPVQASNETYNGDDEGANGGNQEPEEEQIVQCLRCNGFVEP